MVYPGTDISTEKRLLLLVCRQFVYRDVLEHLNNLTTRHDINWEKFHDLAIKHGITSCLHVFIFYRVKGIPSEYILKVQAFNARLARRNHHLLRELHRITEAFKEKDIDIVSYKGAAFASQFYGNIIQRQSVDIDLALDFEHFAAARDIMTTLGYEEFKGTLRDSESKKSRPYHLDYPFVLKKEGRILFNAEFHWTPSHAILGIPVSFKDFEESVIEILINKRQIKTYTKVPQAIFAIIHHGSVDCWGKLKHLVDLAMILKNLNENEMSDLKLLCKKYNLSRSLECGQALLGNLLGIMAFQHLPVSKKWMTDILDGRLAGKWSENKMKMLYFIQSRDSFAQKIGAIFRLVQYRLFIKPHF